jgi:hypothetical protein
MSENASRVPAMSTEIYIPHVRPPQLIEGATYTAHLHNLQQLALDAQDARTTAELTLSAAAQARLRAESAMAAVELMAQGLAAQDFGQAHVGNMHTLRELFAAQVRHAQNAEQAAHASLQAAEQVNDLCRTATTAFRRDHQQLAEAHAAAPHPARTREAYQPL